MGNLPHLETASWLRFRRLRRNTCARCTPRRWQPGDLTRGNRVSETLTEITFYVGYLRDPQGNKIALFSNDPNEPGRDA